MAVLKQHIHHMSQMENNRSLASASNTLTTHASSTTSLNSHNTSVWSVTRDLPPPPYSNTEYTHSNEPPPSYDSTHSSDSLAPPAYSTNAQNYLTSAPVLSSRQHKTKIARSISSLLLCSPDFCDLSSDYYSVSPVHKFDEQQPSLTTNNGDEIHQTVKYKPKTWHSYVNLRANEPLQQRPDFSPSFLQTFSPKNDEYLLDCVRQLVFDMTDFSDLTDAGSPPADLDATSIDSGYTSVQRKQPRRTKDDITRSSGANLQNLSIDSDCSTFFNVPMNRRAVTHKVKVDRFKSIAKQMKEIRKTLLKQRSMQNVNIQTLAVL